MGIIHQRMNLRQFAGENEQDMLYIMAITAVCPIIYIHAFELLIMHINKQQIGEPHISQKRNPQIITRHQNYNLWTNGMI